LVLRDEPIPSLIVVVRLGANTLLDVHLSRSLEECHAKWGIWGFSVLEVPDGDFQRLVRMRPIVGERRQLLVAEGQRLIDAGFPLLPTLDSPHWTVNLSSPEREQAERVRELFEGPIENPAYIRARRGV
jgi:hypothetical protein